MPSFTRYSRDVNYHLNFQASNPGEEDQGKVIRTTLERKGNMGAWGISPSSYENSQIFSVF